VIRHVCNRGSETRRRLGARPEKGARPVHGNLYAHQFTPLLDFYIQTQLWRGSRPKSMPAATCAVTGPAAGYSHTGLRPGTKRNDGHTVDRQGRASRERGQVKNPMAPSWIEGAPVWWLRRAAALGFGAGRDGASTCGGSVSSTVGAARRGGGAAPTVGGDALSNAWARVESDLKRATTCT